MGKATFLVLALLILSIIFAACITEKSPQPGTPVGPSQNTIQQPDELKSVGTSFEYKKASFNFIRLWFVDELFDDKWMQLSRHPGYKYGILDFEVKNRAKSTLEVRSPWADKYLWLYDKEGNRYKGDTRLFPSSLRVEETKRGFIIFSDVLDRAIPYWIYQLTQLNEDQLYGIEPTTKGVPIKVSIANKQIIELETWQLTVWDIIWDNPYRDTIRLEDAKRF